MQSQQLNMGKKAPEFTLDDALGNKVSLSDFRGKKVILYFYPEDFTPGCTAEAQDFRDDVEKFQALGYVIVGVSNDSVAKHCDFKARYQLNFPLLADIDRRVSELYAVMKEQIGDGKTIRRIERSTFVIDEQGNLIHVLRNVVAREHVAQLLELLSKEAAK